LTETLTDPHPNIYDLSRDELTARLTTLGYQRFRTDQIWTWLYQQKAKSFADMSNLPAEMRLLLPEHFRLGSIEAVQEILSSDGETRKLALHLPDGQLIETVLMRYEGVRRTACISTQAGCAMGCVFCATGQMGFARHLSVGEIVEQVLHGARLLEADGDRLSNVVLMGMGEPFHNYDNTLAAIRRLMDHEGLNIGQRHITVSTVGLVPAIRRFAAENLQVRLAISLHAATDDERSALLPVNQRYPIAELMAAVHDYINQTNRRVTFEWTLIEDENDTPSQAHALGSLLQGMLCHVNVIPLNPTTGYGGQPSNTDHINEFVHILEKTYQVPTTVRIRRGIDVNAGCGQLKAAVLRADQ